MHGSCTVLKVNNKSHVACGATNMPGYVQEWRDNLQLSESSWSVYWVQVSAYEGEKGNLIIELVVSTERSGGVFRNRGFFQAVTKQVSQQ